MHRVKTSKKKIFGFSILGIVVVLILGVIFFVPINNGIRSATGNDTPTDKLIKDELVKKVKSKKTGDPKHDENVDKYAGKLKGTKMSTIMKAANNEEEAAELIHQSSSLSESASKKAAKALFSDEKYDGIRKSMSEGNWVETYSQYQKLNSDGSISQLRQTIGQ